MVEIDWEGGAGWGEEGCRGAEGGWRGDATGAFWNRGEIPRRRAAATQHGVICSG